MSSDSADPFYWMRVILASNRGELIAYSQWKLPVNPWYCIILVRFAAPAGRTDPYIYSVIMP